MEKNRKIVIMSVLIALIALLIIMLVLAFMLLSQRAKKAHVENLIDPLAIQNSGWSGGSSVNIYDGDDADNDEDSNDPEISSLPNIIMDINTIDDSLDLDAYVSDGDDSDSALEWTYSGNDNISVSIDNITHVVTFTPDTDWTGSEDITFRVEDPDGNYDTDTTTVSVVSGGSNSPVISSIPDVTMLEDTTDNSIDLDDYVFDNDNADSELTWTYSGNTNIAVNIDNTTHVVTFIPAPDWTGSEDITFTVTDPDSNTDADIMTVLVTPNDDPAVWQSLSSQQVNEDSSDGTVVYSNILSRVTDPDSPIVLTIGTNSHFDIKLNDDDLVIDNLEANWYGTETVVLYANGVPATFTLTIRHLLDDCAEICAWGKCYEICD